MVEVALQFDFQGQLINHVMRFDHFLGDFLQGIYCFSLLVFDHRHHSEFTLTQCFHSMEVVY